MTDFVFHFVFTKGPRAPYAKFMLLPSMAAQLKKKKKKNNAI